MDNVKFDALTRAFATGTSRRTAIKGIFGGVIGGVAVATRLDFAGAQQCRTPGEVCQENPGEGNECCAGLTCSDIDPTTGNGTCSDCASGTFCPSTGLCSECCADSDCTSPDSCTVVGCVEGSCEIVEGGCPAGDICCPAQGGSCAPCCSDADCPAGTPICYIPGDPTNATCVECVDAGDCGPCESCEGNQCVPYAEYCPETQQCYNPMEGECCYDNECGDEYCINGKCEPCRYDSDCPDCMECNPNGQCVYLICPEGKTCCGGYECIPEDECCKIPGEYCGLVEVSAADGSPQLDCCDGLVCCENWNSQGSICAECCNDWDCPEGAWCHEGWCEYPDYCDYDKDCPKGTCCCKDGSCSGKCCHHPYPPKPAPPAPAPAPVTNLPSTGAGESTDSTGLLGAAALGAAAALYAAKKMRETPEASAEE